MLRNDIRGKSDHIDVCGMQASGNQPKMLRTRSTSLDSLAVSSNAGRALGRSDTTINKENLQSLSGMPHFKANLTPELKALKLQAQTSSSPSNTALMCPSRKC
jgi:hypothetical protein